MKVQTGYLYQCILELKKEKQKQQLFEKIKS